MTKKYLSRISLIALCLTFLAGCIGFARQTAQVTAESQARTLIARAKTLMPTATSTATATATPTAIPLPDEITDTTGIIMHLVPAGEFTMGYTSEQEGSSYDRPAHQVTLDNYYIDVYEVTNAAYKLCVDAGKCVPPIKNDRWNISYDKPEYSDYPVVSIYWDMAVTYCKWREARLPTEAEWEKAARGTDKRKYPWGDTISCDSANYDKCVDKSQVIKMKRVGSYPSGISPYGLYEMAGNVAEWVNDAYDENYYQESPQLNPLGPDARDFPDRVVRGGSFNDYADRVQSWMREVEYPTNLGYPDIGLRCARGTSP